MSSAMIRVFLYDWNKSSTDPVGDLLLADIPNAANELRQRCYRQLEEKYVGNAPEHFQIRLDQEMDVIERQGYAPYCLLAARLSDRCKELGGVYSVPGNGGSSLVAYLAGITKTNPLPPHYYCRNCGHIELVDTEACISGFDLLGSGTPHRNCTYCGKKLSADGHNLDAFFFVGSSGEKHPFFQFNVPDRLIPSLNRFLCSQGTVRERIPYKETISLSPEPVNLTVREHPLLTLLDMLQRASSVSADTICLEEVDVRALAAQQQSPPYITKEAYALVQRLKPSCFSGLIKAAGFADGMGVWENNAEDLIGTVCSTNEAIVFRDDILQTLQRYGVESFPAIKLTECTRKGNGSFAIKLYLDMLMEKDIPGWYLSSMLKIKYLPCKADVLENWIPILQVAWYQTRFPEAYAKAIQECYPAEA